MVLPELWFSSSSWLKSQTWGTDEQYWATNPGTTPNRNFCMTHFQMNDLAWECIMHPETIWHNNACVCVCWYILKVLYVCFPVGYANACVRSRSEYASKRMLTLSLQLSECQAAFSTWICRSSPMHSYSYTLHWSPSPAQGRGYSAANFPKAFIQRRATVSKSL